MKKYLTIITIFAAIIMASSCQKELPDAIKNVDVSQGEKTPMSTQDNPADQGSLPSEDVPPSNGSLEGTWKGNMYISFSVGGHTYDAAYTEITFLTDPYSYSSGVGYWVDYYDTGKYSDLTRDYVANHIDWEVNNRTIIIYFREEGIHLQISDYRLNNDRFYGTLSDSGHSVTFELVHTSSSNWNSYNYWGYDGWLSTL